MNILRVVLSNNNEVFESDSLYDDYITGRKIAGPSDEINSINFLINYCNTTLYENYSPDKADGEPTYLDISELTIYSRLAIQLRDKRRQLLRESLSKLETLKNYYLLQIENENENTIVEEQNQILL